MGGVQCSRPGGGVRGRGCDDIIRGHRWERGTNQGGTGLGGRALLLRGVVKRCGFVRNTLDALIYGVQ